MLVIPDPNTAVIDPFAKEPTVSVIGDIVDPITKENYSRDPRNIAQKADAYLKQTGIADTCYIGPEPEFFIFDDVRFESKQNGAMFRSTRSKAAWNSAGRRAEPGPQAALQGRLLPGRRPMTR